MSLSARTRVVASNQQVSAPVDDGLALLDLHTNTYFALDAVGATVWAQLGSPATVEAIVAAVTATYEVDGPTATADVTALLEELIAAGLAQVAP